MSWGATVDNPGERVETRSALALPTRTLERSLCVSLDFRCNFLQFTSSITNSGATVPDKKLKAILIEPDLQL